MTGSMSGSSGYTMRTISWPLSPIYNAVLLEGDSVGQILLYGKGAGAPTASAVVSVSWM